MGKRIDVAEIYENVKLNLKIGVRQNRIFVKKNGNWHPFMQSELSIEIRRLYQEHDQKKISSSAIKEVIERLLQDPSLQVKFAEETENNWLKLRDSVFNVTNGEIINTIAKDFGYFLDFSYIDSNERKGRMRNFDAYLESVFPEETETKKRLMLEIIGYTLSDYTNAKAGFFFLGASNSGKSTILELIQRILPEHAVTTIPLYRLENRFNLARLADSRVNICTELTSKSFAATDIFKMLTSNEVVTAEHKGCRPFEFRMRCKSINAGNMLPDINENEGISSIVNRMIILLFPRSIARENQDLSLLEKLWDERDCIFSSALDALVGLKKRNFIFQEANDTVKLKNQLRTQERSLDSFISEYCVIDKNGKEHLTTLFEAFHTYCEENLLECRCSKTQFSQYLCRRSDIQREKFRIAGSKPLSGMKGIRLKTNEEYLAQDSDSYSPESNGAEILWNNGTPERKEDKDGSKKNNR